MQGGGERGPNRDAAGGRLSILQLLASLYASYHYPTAAISTPQVLALLSPLAEQGPCSPPALALCLPSPLPRSHPSPPVDPFLLSPPAQAHLGTWEAVHVPVSPLAVSPFSFCPRPDPCNLMS